MSDSYSAVADEYYNEILHPTCNDFGYASLSLLRDYLRLRPLQGVVCEVGAGLSALLTALDGNQQAARVVVTDNSREMLSHSQTRFAGQAEFVLSDASHLPFPGQSVDMLTASLGDPYNSPEFWHEVHRVSKLGARIFFSTPSWEWASAFRSVGKNEREGSALFITQSGKKIYLPSCILPEIEQGAMMKAAGLHVEQISHFRLSDLKSAQLPTSPKLGGYLDDDDSVVTSFWVKK
ncbi:methyltransferase domain-containing protein [Mesorhizobium sp. M0494]|uniref:class I SAM-dependent methyltransferase n=1 Tax=Mesorhizobium sp. M0494 TaxID=2956951 RepID=UPI00333CB260